MTVLRIVATGAIVVTALLAASHAPQAAPKRGERVTVTGCPYRGASAPCLLIRGRDGTVYNISSVSPRPRESGRMIQVRGAVTDRASLCAEGTVLDRIRWTRTRQRCLK